MRMETGSPFMLKGFSSVPSFQLRHVRSAIRLFPYEEIPLHMKENPYITTGYRCYLSARDCLRSMFVLSNELVNIWTHLGMAFLWIVLLLYDQLHVLPRAGAKIEDHFIHLTYVLCVQVCMVASAGYHTFSSHATEHVCFKWYRFDIAGIVTGILGCYIPGLHYGFWCFPIGKMFYLMSVLAMIVISVLFITHPRYLTKSWRRHRLTHLTTLALFGIVPAVHWVFLSSKRDVMLFLPNIITLYFILGLAFFFYTSKFPERCMPGRFDLIGQSHNIWHILTAFSFIYWRNAALNLMAYRMQFGCVVS